MTHGILGLVPVVTYVLLGEKSLPLFSQGDVPCSKDQKIIPTKALPGTGCPLNIKELTVDLMPLAKGSVKDCCCGRAPGRPSSLMVSEHCIYTGSVYILYTTGMET